MDRKSIIILAAAIALLFLVGPVVDHFFPPKPAPPSLAGAPTNGPATTQNPETGTNPPLSAPVPAPVEAVAAPSQPEKTLTLSNQDLIFQFTSYGGGLKTVQLRDYPAVVARPGQLANGQSEKNFATLNGAAPHAVLALLGNDLQGDNLFELSQSGPTVVARKTLANGLQLVKQFDIGTNYLFAATVSLENTSGQPIPIPNRQLVVGTATAAGPVDDPTVLGAMWYNGYKSLDIKEPWFANRTLGCLPGTPRSQYDEGASNVVWAAVHSQFFALAAIPASPAPGIVIHQVRVPPPEAYGLANAKPVLLTNGFETALTYPATVLEAHQTLQHRFTFYAGAKEYNRLAQIGERMKNNLDLIMDFSGVFGFFSKLLLLCLNGLHALGLAYGLTIIVLTIIIKLVFWPLTNAATKSQKRLQELQPQLKAIADKYKDEPVKKNQKTMEFMKLHKVSPLGSCLPMLLQIPVFFGFYWMLRNAIELRGVHFLWAYDLSQPDTIAYLAGVPVNPLPLIMGASQLWQAHLTPPSPGMDPNQQKIMRYMPLIFIAVFYRMASGLTLYWTVQNLLTILQTKLTKTGTPEEKAAPKPAAIIPAKKKK